MVYAQLRSYILNKAPKDFVMHTVLKLNDLAKERRFMNHLGEIKQEDAPEEEKKKLRELWTDEVPRGARERYGGLLSIWDCAKEDHMERLSELIGTWVNGEAIDQQELEARLQQFTFIKDPRTTRVNNEEQTAVKSFKDAVAGEEETRKKRNEAESEYQRWHDMCMTPADPIRVLRAMTDLEKQAIEMVLHHQLEVPIPPRFLIQIMDARELAAFTDLFMAIEYPLYAHLLPGQRFGSNMTKQVILQHIHMGAEAAIPQKLQILEFKKDLSRVEINADTRVVTVTFRGKQTAMKWVGWGMPLGMRMLPLEDYETQRGEAKINNKLIKLDFYRFTIAVKRGSLTSSDLYWVLTQKFGLKVQALAHVEIGGGNINDKQWRVSIKASACPAGLRQLSTVEVDGVILTVYHHEVHSHWPCSTCGAPDHSGRFCRTLQDRVQATRKTHGRQAEGKLPSNRGQGGRDYSSREQPVSIEQLLAQLRGSNSGRKTGIAEQRPERSIRKAEKKGRPTLPREWEQSMRARQDTGTDQQDKTQTPVEGGKQSGKQLEELTAGDEQERRLRSEEADAEGENYEYGDEDDAMADSDECEPTSTNGNVDYADNNAPMEDIISERESENTDPEKEGKTPTRHEPTFSRESRNSRQRSLSPKRQLSDTWKVQGDAERGKTCKAQKTTTNGANDSREEKIGYESEEVGPPKNKKPIQQYMHSYVTTHTHEPGEALRKRTQQGTQEDTTKLEKDGFLLTGTKRGDDMGRPLQDWLDIAGGQLTDVAANGHCGWLAFMAALHNVTIGLSPLTADVVKSANSIKKQVMNNMIANVVDEYKEHAAETEAALVAAGKFVSNQDSDKDKLCALANHYADQRNRSVKASVPMNYWVRPEHIKAMAMHARETVFVLDVLQEENAHLQAYGYQDVVLSDKTAIETGVVFTLPSHTGADILRELTAVGTLPIIMVLHYSNMGNHYQAVTYEPMRYQAYTEQWRALTDRRNSILIKYGGRALDAEPYDADKLAKAAAKELNALRRAAKEAKLTRPMREPPHVEKEFDSENKIDDERKLTDCDKYAPKQREQDLEGRRPGSQLAEGIAATKQVDNRQGSTAPEPKPPTAHYPPTAGRTNTKTAEGCREKSAEQVTTIPPKVTQPTPMPNDRTTI